MANQTITQLPAAGPITGTELVPIVQNGGTYQTTTAAIANSPTLTQTFLTESQELTLNNSRYLSVNTGLQLTDGGATSFLRIGMTGAANSLNLASAGFIVKDGPNSVVSRSLTTSGPGISISNADGTGANPIFALTGSVGSLANFSGLGVLALRPGGTIAGLTVTGTANQIAVTDGDGQFGDPVIGLANNPVLPGTGSAKIPVGTNAQRPAGSNGEVRYNTDLAVFEGYSSGSWLPFQAGATVNSFSAGTTGFSPSSPTTGAVVLSGTLNVANGGTGATSLTGYVKGSGTSAFTASPTVPYTDVSGLGTIATQNANNVALTGGTISGVGINNSIIGAATPAAGTFTSVAMTTGTISTAPVNGNDIVNKTYADSIASGINFHQSCSYATTAALPSVTYNNGSSGVGATLTATANGALVIDSYTFVSPGDIGKRVLIKNQSNQAQNGVYTVTQVGNGSTPFILTRATDFDSSGPGVDQIDAGDFFLITAGTANANTSWVQQTPLPIIVGTTAIVFTQFGAPLTYSAGTGLNESPAYTFNIANTGVAASTYGSASQVPVFAVNAQGQLTSVTNTPIAIAAGAVSGLAASATTDTTNASNITSGTLGTSRLSGSYTGITGVGTLGFGTWNANPIGVAYGGTGLTSTPTNGQLPIGNGTGYTLATLTAGTNVFINNTSGGITISATAAAGGTVTSVDVSGGTTGLTTSGGPVTVSGTITLAGTLVVANGGTGATTLTGYVKGNGTSAMTASAAIPNTDITGLGTMSTQNAGTVAITGGSIEGTTVGATTAATVRGTTVTATTEFSGPGTGLTGTASGLSIGGNAANVTGTVAVANGGTGQTSLTANNVILGNGTSAVQFVAPGTNGNVLTSNGTTWTSAPAGASLTGTTQSVSPFETSLGVNAGTSVTGLNATLVGYGAGTALTSGNYNTGIGSFCLQNMTTASDNVAVGFVAGGSQFGSRILGDKNTAVGNYSLIGNLNDFNATSVENTAVGYAAMQRSQNSDYSAAFGAYALGVSFGSAVDGDYNAAFGHSSGRAVTSGAQNTLLGANAGFSGTNNLTTGSNNTIIGFNAAASSATVSNETTIGNASASTFRVPGVAFTLTGSKFTWGSNSNGVATSGIAFGFAANQAGSGAGNICIGDFAGRFEGGNTGGSNVFIGGGAGVGSGSSFSSPFNVGVGASALQNVSGGGYNTAVGTEAGDKITTGTNNLILGYSAASSGTNDLTTGTNNTVIGYNAATSSATVSNTVTLGNSSITTLRCQVTTITSLSDARDKANIGELPAGLNFVKALRPVEFDWNMRDGGKVGVYDTGFIAQELKAAQESTGVNIPGLVFEDNPDRLEAGYGKLIPVLVKAIQELNAKVEYLEAKLRGN